MQFIRLRLNGFKSFVDPTELVIAPGLTGVVGPNGCGKSNLLEALRWVMGENRPSAMRGGGMEDVIFAGTATRPARHFAEVQLDLDNSDRTAPAAFNHHASIDVTRRITREAGSAYRAAGGEVRARDVQMLFADASTGAHSPALVRQGQIAGLIGAKPKARRRILEEAAGISGLYQRRHEAELKLRGAEGNLDRVEDLLEALAQQLSQLARQARAAARYREIGQRLRLAEGALLWRRWQEADDVLEEARAALQGCLVDAGRAEAAARGAAQAREEADAGLPPVREEEAVAGAIVQRATVERDKVRDRLGRAEGAIRSIEGRLGQIEQDFARQDAQQGDAAGAMGALGEERDALAAKGQGERARIAEAEVAAQAAAAGLGEAEARGDRAREFAARLAARHQSATARAEETARAAARLAAAAGEAAKGLDAAQEAAKGTEVHAGEARKAAEVAGEAAERAEAALLQADAARADAVQAEAVARAAEAEASGGAGAIRAEVRALGRLLAAGRGDAPLLDAVSVEPGYEAALGAALGEELQTAEADWAVLPDLSSAALPPGAEPLAGHVRAPAALSRRLALVGVVEGVPDRAAMRPGVRLVSREGALWRWDGLGRPAGEGGAAAMRLAQRNRLAALAADLSAAEARAEAAAQDHAAAKAAAREAVEADRFARAAREASGREAARTARDLASAEAAGELAKGRIETLDAQAARLHEEAAAAEEARREAAAALEGLGDADAARAEAEMSRREVAEAREAMTTARDALAAARREAEARAARLAQVEKDLAGWTKRVLAADGHAAELHRRREKAEADLLAARGAPADLRERLAGIDGELKEAKARLAAAEEARRLAETAQREAQIAERDAERRAGEAREARVRAEARASAAAETRAAVDARIREETEAGPDELLAALGDPAALPPVEKAEADLAGLRRQREAMGAVNLRAEEDAEEVRVEHDVLGAEAEDLRGAIDRLRRGIAELNREGRQRLLDAFGTVNRNFGTLFTHLFGGGEARLELVEADDPLEAGLEILCQPPGKKLSTLSLLSGGEQTLTAMALIFAVFLANPAPICVLDEVDAPLDDANVTRFCDLLDEMTKRTDTRFLIITHHAITMSRMDRLFGVTMVEQGVSQLVSVDLGRAEALVA
ncbi:condensin subunit Smc [Hasllibacter halocynthiae]|uniref:Chromosome partition protein Smc n=1 Tax=Hasllibacter halocynthiae TaxID=595589 RepID=A0A2T0X382_9RHOB|nr:AAA family ATPase [Hasllibacter halocynthiae]PRY93398.1 condensin subunit Smc [Hasllibacter halocynthiae]